MHNIPLLRANKNKRRTNFKKTQCKQTAKQELNHNKHLRKQSLLNVSVNLGQNNYLNAFETTHNSSKNKQMEETQPRNARKSDSDSSVTELSNCFDRGRNVNKNASAVRDLFEYPPLG